MFHNRAGDRNSLEGKTGHIEGDASTEGAKEGEKRCRETMWVSQNDQGSRNWEFGDVEKEEV